MMWKRVLGMVLAFALLAGGCAAAGPAQEILEDLAESARTNRIISGVTTISIGAAVGIAGTLWLTDPTLQTYAWIGGGLIAAPGILTLAIPSLPEIEYRTSGDSETSSALALERMAASGRLERLISGVVNVAAGVASLIFPYSYVTEYDSLYSAIYSFGSAAIDFFVPSAEERAYNRYREAAGVAG